MKEGYPSSAPRPPRSGRIRLFVLSGLLLSCATPGPPQTFRFATNHDPTAAIRCATNRLRIEGFQLLDSVPDSSAAVALRRGDSEGDVGASEWWRIELSTTQDVERRTVVQSVAGVAREEHGPYVEPGVVLQGIVGKISASCTW